MSKRLYTNLVKLDTNAPLVPWRIATCSCSVSGHPTQRPNRSKLTPSTGNSGLKVGIGTACVIAIILKFALWFMCCEGRCYCIKQKNRTSIRITPSESSHVSQQDRNNEETPSMFGSTASINLHPPPYQSIHISNNPPSYETIYTSYDTSTELAYPGELEHPQTPPPMYDDINIRR